MALLCLYALVATLYGWLKREPPGRRLYMGQDNAAAQAERDVKVYMRMIEFAMKAKKTRELHITLPFDMLNEVFGRYPDLRYHVLGVVGGDANVVILLPLEGVLEC